MSNWYNTGPQNLIKAKFKFFNENIRSNKDSGQIKRNESQDSQGLCPNFIQSVMACLDFQNTYFMEHLLMAAFIHFRSTGFSEQLKVHALFIA